MTFLLHSPKETWAKGEVGGNIVRPTGEHHEPESPTAAPSSQRP